MIATLRRILSGAELRHRYRPAGSSQRKTEPLTSPDDLTMLGRRLLTGRVHRVAITGASLQPAGLEFVR